MPSLSFSNTRQTAEERKTDDEGGAVGDRGEEGGASSRTMGTLDVAERVSDEDGVRDRDRAVEESPS